MPVTKEERQRRDAEAERLRQKYIKHLVRTLKAPPTEFRADAFHVFPDLVPFTERELDLFRRLVFATEEMESRLVDVRRHWEPKKGL